MGREIFQEKSHFRRCQDDFQWHDDFSVSLWWGMQWCNKSKDWKSSNNMKFAAVLAKLPRTRRRNPIQEAAGIKRSIWYCAVLGISDLQITSLPSNRVGAEQSCSSHSEQAGSESSAHPPSPGSSTVVSDTQRVTSARLSCAISEEQSCSLHRNTQNPPWLLAAQLHCSQNCLEHWGAQTQPPRLYFAVTMTDDALLTRQNLLLTSGK